jgi:hypothetical protein
MLIGHRLLLSINWRSHVVVNGAKFGNGDSSAAMSPLQFQKRFDCMPRGNACSRVNWMRQVRHSRSATKGRANSNASIGDSLAGPHRDLCDTA